METFPSTRSDCENHSLADTAKNPETHFRIRATAKPVFARLPGDFNLLPVGAGVYDHEPNHWMVNASCTTRTEPAQRIGTSSLILSFLKSLPFRTGPLASGESPGRQTYRIIDLNPAAAAITGSTLENLLGRTLADFPTLLEKIFPAEWFPDPFIRGSKRLGRSLHTVMSAFARNLQCPGLSVLQELFGGCL